MLFLRTPVLQGGEHVRTKIVPDLKNEPTQASDPGGPSVALLQGHGANLFAKATSLGWVDDGGEGPLEYLMRRAYETGSDDARNGHRSE